MQKKLILLLLCALCLSHFSASAQKLSVATNAVDYMYFGTLNAEGQFALAQHWSLSAAFRYNPFTFKNNTDDQFQNRQRTFSLGSRYWTWNTFSGWWFSLKGQWQEYNEGGVASLETSEGDRFGAGLGAGYTLMLNKHFNIDFGLALWGGWETYTVYACPNCGRIMDEGSRTFFKPNEALISLLYVF